jgi:tripartite-type tricarboxylate transporter receptor subunit TctC
VNPSLIAKLPYDNIRDFAPVSLIATAPHLLAVHPSLPVRSDCCWTQAKNTRPLIAPSTHSGATNPVERSAPRKVVVSQRP